MSVTTNLTNGKYTLSFESGISITDTAKPNVIQDTVVYGQGGVPAITATLNDGTGANNANVIWNGMLVIAGSGSTTLVLSFGLTEAGAAVVFAKIRRMLIRLRTPAAGKKVVVGGAASHPWAPWLSTLSVTEDVASLLFRESDVDGWTVGSGSADQLKFANPGGSSITVDVSLMGE